MLPTTIEIGAVSITEKGEANGIATLNSQGRLVQMPDAEDVGAHPNTWLPAASEIRLKSGILKVFLGKVFCWIAVVCGSLNIIRLDFLVNPLDHSSS